MSRAAELTDPRTLAVIRSGLALVSDAMGITVVRAAYSTMIKGGADVSSALFTADGRLAALSETSMVGHLAPLRSAVRAILEDFPAPQMQPGDVYMMNDPYRGGVHSNDIQIFVPVFVEGVLEFITATMVHVADLGGITAGGLSGTATDVFQEGLTLPPVRLHRRGKPVKDVYSILAANTRTPEVTLGDVRALIAGALAGERELLAMVNRFGSDGLEIAKAAIDRLIEYTEERVRLRIDELEQTAATGEGLIDDDGVRIDEPLRVRVRIEVREREMIVDFDGTDAQAAGPINAPESPAISAALYGALVILADPDIPINEGVFPPIRILRPEGSLVAPRHPAAVNARGTVAAAMLDAMLDAMVQLVPGRAVAGSGINHVMTVAIPGASGVRSFHDRDYGGAGAQNGAEGVDAHGYGFFAGRANVTPMEVIEREFPVRYECLRLRAGSGGQGRWSGGRGIEKTLRLLADATLTVRTDRIRFPPRGAAGGRPGAAGGWVLNAGTPDERWLRSKETNVGLQAGDTVTMLTPGGGGFGAR